MKDCNELDLFVNFQTIEQSHFTCEVSYPSKEIKIHRYPESGWVSSFDCCGNQTFLYKIKDVTMIEKVPGIDF